MTSQHQQQQQQRRGRDGTHYNPNPTTKILPPMLLPSSLLHRDPSYDTFSRSSITQESSSSSSRVSSITSIAQPGQNSDHNEWAGMDPYRRRDLRRGPPINHSSSNNNLNDALLQHSSFSSRSESSSIASGSSSERRRRRNLAKPDSLKSILASIEERESSFRHASHGHRRLPHPQSQPVYVGPHGRGHAPAHVHAYSSNGMMQGIPVVASVPFVASHPPPPSNHYYEHPSQYHHHQQHQQMMMNQPHVIPPNRHPQPRPEMPSSNKSHGGLKGILRNGSSSVASSHTERRRRSQSVDRKPRLPMEVQMKQNAIKDYFNKM